MKKGYLRNVLNEGYVTGAKKRYAVTQTYGPSTGDVQTNIVNSWSEVEDYVAQTIESGEEVLSIYEVGAKVKIPNVSKRVDQVRKERVGPSLEDEMSGRY